MEKTRNRILLVILAISTGIALFLGENGLVILLCTMILLDMLIVVFGKLNKIEMCLEQNAE